VFWALGIAFFLDVIAINGTLTHIVALLTDRGVALQAAVAALSGTGIALILGRILSGWCLDRLWGPYVAVAFFILPMIGIAILATGAAGLAPVIGAVTLGLGIGAEVDLMAFFASRYFGMRNYAKIYGTMFGIFAFGVGIGPALSGASFDVFRSYTPIFIVYEIMLVISCAIFLRLGPYPYPAQEPVQARRVCRCRRNRGEAMTITDETVRPDLARTEYLGLVYGYFGPGAPPAFPPYPAPLGEGLIENAAPPLVPCNYLQCFENTWTRCMSPLSTASAGRIRVSTTSRRSAPRKPIGACSAPEDAATSCVSASTTCRTARGSSCRRWTGWRAPAAGASSTSPPPRSMTKPTCGSSPTMSG
jgi:MFS family permease